MCKTVPICVRVASTIFNILQCKITTSPNATNHIEFSSLPSASFPPTKNQYVDKLKAISAQTSLTFTILGWSGWSKTIFNILLGKI